MRQSKFEERYIWEAKLKKDIFGNKTKEFRYSMIITNSPLVAWPIKMQDLH